MRNIQIIIFILFTPFFYCAADKITLTLDDAYQKTLEQSEKLKISEQNILSAEAKYDEALSEIFPKVNLVLNERFRDTDSSSGGSSSNVTGSGGVFVGNRDDRFQTIINIKQPIFSGFRDVLLAKAAKAEIQSEKFNRERLKETLYQSLAELFFQTLLYQRDLKELGRTEGVLNDRIAELTNFVKLGKSKDSEAVSAQSDLESLRVTKAQVEGVLAATKEMLAFLTGVESKNLELADKPLLNKPENLDFYLAQSDERKDLKALDQRLESAEKQLTSAERERWPQIALEGNAYPLQSPDNGTNAEVSLRLDFPLFEAGRIDARVRQQNAYRTTLELQAKELRRNIEREIRTAYVNLEASQKEKQQLKTLVESADKNYQLQKKDYALGIVTNLDVLQAIRQLQDAKRKLIAAEIDEKINRIKLFVAAGGLGA